MKASLAFLTLALAAGSFAAQDTHTFARKYVEGEKDKYTLTMTASTGMGPVQMNMTMAQTVKKVYENGDADVETTVADMKMLMNGSEVNMPGAADTGPKTTTGRFDKHGQPVGKPAAGNAGAGMMGGMDQLMQMGARLSQKPLTVGQAVPIESDAKDKVKGTITLESVAAGVAKIVAKMSILTGEGATPIKVATTSWIDAATSKANKVEGTVTDVPTGGFPVDSIKFVIERLK